MSFGGIFKNLDVRDVHIASLRKFHPPLFKDDVLPFPTVNH